MVETFDGLYHVPLVRAGAGALRLKLAGVTDPERKRMIIGGEFIRVFGQARKLGDVSWLVQGTLYSDVSNPAHRRMPRRSSRTTTSADCPTT